jgi:hypothetical protein
MANKLNPNTDPSQSIVYQMRVEGHLDPLWTEWFGGPTITLEENGDRLLTGPVVEKGSVAWIAKKSAGFRNAIGLGHSSPIQ